MENGIEVKIEGKKMTIVIDMEPETLVSAEKLFTPLLMVQTKPANMPTLWTPRDEG